jgi:hypothetical protein
MILNLKCLMKNSNMAKINLKKIVNILWKIKLKLMILVINWSSKKFKHYA